MGLIRGGLVFILGVLLLLSFFAMNTLATFSSSLSYENVRKEVYPILYNPENQILPKEIVGDINLTKVIKSESEKIVILCKIENRTIYNLSYEGFQISIPCEVAALGPDAIINKTIDDILYGVYYTKYDCGFWDCFSNKKFPFFLLSQKARDYWQSKFYLFLSISLILIVLIVLFMENRINAPIIIGILLALSAIPILKLSSLISTIVGQPISFIIKIFFSKSSKIFWISFITGLVLIASGFSIKIMNSGLVKKLIQQKPEEKQTPSSATQPTQITQSQPKKKKK